MPTEAALTVTSVPAAVAPTLRLNTIKVERTYYIGILSISTTYVAEVRGLVLGLQIVLDLYTISATPRK